MRNSFMKVVKVAAAAMFMVAAIGFSIPNFLHAVPDQPADPKIGKKMVIPVEVRRRSPDGKPKVFSPGSKRYEAVREGLKTKGISTVGLRVFDGNFSNLGTATQDVRPADFKGQTNSTSQGVALVIAWTKERTDELWQSYADDWSKPRSFGDAKWSRRTDPKGVAEAGLYVADGVWATDQWSTPGDWQFKPLTWIVGIRPKAQISDSPPTVRNESAGFDRTMKGRTKGQRALLFFRDGSKETTLKPVAIDPYHKEYAEALIAAGNSTGRVRELGQFSGGAVGVELFDTEEGFTKKYRKGTFRLKFPKVDYQTERLLVVHWGGKPQIDYDLKTLKGAVGDEIRIDIESSTPKGKSGNAITSPALWYAIPKGKPVHVHISGDRIQPSHLYKDFTPFERGGLKLTVEGIEQSKVKVREIPVRWGGDDKEKAGAEWIETVAQLEKKLKGQLVRKMWPKIDFKKERVLVVRWGAMPQTDYGLRTLKTSAGEEIRIDIESSVPKGMAGDAITYPRVWYAIPKGKPVHVHISGDRIVAGRWYKDFAPFEKNGIKLTVEGMKDRKVKSD